MGADLIGWFAKGPAELTVTDEQKNQLVDAITPVLHWWRGLGEDRESIIGDHVDECPNTCQLGMDTDDFVAYFIATLYPPENLEDLDNPVDPTDEQIESHLRAAIDSLIAEWPPNEYRDCAMHPDPDDESQVICFAGEMTWGDSPDGAGFKALQSLAMTGVGSAVGIKCLQGYATIKVG